MKTTGSQMTLFFQELQNPLLRLQVSLIECMSRFAITTHNDSPGNVSLLIEQRRQEIASDPTKDVFCSPLIADGSLGTLDANGCLTREQISTLSVYVEGAVFSANVTIPPPEGSTIPVKFTNI